MANDVKVLKLITGEEVIERTKEGEDPYLVSLEKPMILQMLPPNTTTGQVGFSMIPWIKAAKSEKVLISTEHIIAEDDASEQTEKNYLQVVTGLSL